MQLLREDSAWLTDHAESDGADGWVCKKAKTPMRFLRLTLTLMSRRGRFKGHVSVRIPLCCHCPNEPIPEKGAIVHSRDLVHLPTPAALRRQQ